MSRESYWIYTPPLLALALLMSGPAGAMPGTGTASLVSASHLEGCAIAYPRGAMGGEETGARKSRRAGRTPGPAEGAVTAGGGDIVTSRYDPSVHLPQHIDTGQHRPGARPEVRR